MPTIDRTRAIAICVLVILLTATTACKNSHVKTAEYDVLSAFINAKLADPNGEASPEPTGDGIAKVAIFNMTESNEQWESSLMDGKGQPIPWTQTASSLQSQVPTLQRTTIDAFREVNEKQITFQRSFSLAVDYELLDKSQLDIVLKNGSWPAFYKRFPRSPGIVNLSRVGMSADGTQALFYTSHACGGLCGGGFFVVMERRDGHWLNEREIEMWMS